MAEEQGLNLYQKLAIVRKRVAALKKNKRGHGYDYVDEESILSRITGAMDKYQISLIPSILHESFQSEQMTTTKKKYSKEIGVYDDVTAEYLVSGDMEFTWVNNENPEERIVVPWVFVGSQRDPSQAFGGGLTYAQRYFLLKYFNSATSNDDPDAFRSKQYAAEEEQERLITEKVIEEIDKIVRAYLDANPDGVPRVKELVGKYNKAGDYFKIQEVPVAEKLLSEVKQELLPKE